jgi:hypothetical protein
MKIIQLIICCLLLFIYTACAQPGNSGLEEYNSTTYTPLTKTELQQLNEQKLLNAKQMSTSVLTYFVTRVPNNKFGYTIFVNGRLYIEQYTIPARDGTDGFKTKEDAESIACLVIKKLGNGEFPPTVTLQDLQEHGIYKVQ